jgi:thiamine-monophosphate kinase
MTGNQKLTRLSELGEFKLIEHLTKDFQLKNESTLKGIGDDAAVIHCIGGEVVLTTDLLVEGIHFNLVYTPLKHIGYKAVVVNLSDIYAMNARPSQITVSLAVSNKFSVQALEDFYSGVKLACEKYAVDLIGGDTSSSLTGMMISISALGFARADRLVYRDGASVNDLICVSGDLGAAYTGLQILERERKIFESDHLIQPELTGYDYILGRQLKPEARVDIIEKLDELNVLPTSMIDISDGLSSDMLHICHQSGVGCRIYQEKIPVSQDTAAAAKELHLEPLICALHGGEDYELLFTVGLAGSDKVAGLPRISVIGHITGKGEGAKLITAEGNEILLKAQGWDAMNNSHHS